MAEKVEAPQPTSSSMPAFQKSPFSSPSQGASDEGPCGEDARLAPFYACLRQEGDPGTGLSALLQPLLSDVSSRDEETVASALRFLGYVVHHEEIAAAISGECASATLRSLSKLVISTDQKALCSLAVWCIGIQEFGQPVLEACFKSILQAIVHAIDNPMGSKAVTFEALQAVVTLSRKVPEMKGSSSVWAPAIYKKLLSADRRDRDMAERCLKDVGATLLPSGPSLSKVVAADINQTLLSKMEKMVRSKILAVPTIRAWGWLIRLLGSQAGENRKLVNQMLKIAEITFTSHDSQVQIASLAAWEALIDALLDSQVIPVPHGAQSISPSPKDTHQSNTSPSMKRLKLLMMPLLTIMNGEKDQSVQLACWRTWTYLAHKLGSGINHSLASTLVVAPMFESILKSGPDNGNSWVWDPCLNALEALIACKVAFTTQSFSISTEGKVASPRTPTCKLTGVEAEGNLQLEWAPWSLCSLIPLLDFVRILWNHGIRVHNPSDATLSLNGALRMLLLLVRGVEGDEKGTIKPSLQHIESVHALLRFVSALSCESVSTADTKVFVSAVWSALECLMELHSLVLSSSFYKLPLHGSSPRGRQDQKEIDNTPGDLVTPIVFMIAMWFQFGCTIVTEDEDKEQILERLKRLAVSATSGLGVMGNLLGVVNLLDWLHASHACKNSTTKELVVTLPITNLEADEQLPINVLPSENHSYILLFWKIFAERLTGYLEDINDVPAVEGSIGDSGYGVVHSFLLFPLQVYLHVPGVQGDPNDGATSTSMGPLESIIATWLSLFECSLRISSLKCSQPNFFASGLCQRFSKLIEKQLQMCDKIEGRSLAAEFLAAIVSNVLKHTEILSLATLAINRKKRLGSFMGVSAQTNYSLGSEFEDTSNIREIMSLTSRFLDLSWDQFMAGKTYWLDPTTRTLGALASFVAHLYSQNDILMFLQDFSKALSKLLCSSQCILDDKRNTSSSKFMQSLEKVWEKLLMSLQKCQPPLAFDSNLLSLQAPLLCPTLQHSQITISNCTLAFWEATYGSKAAFLKYPPCLVPILSQLRDKVRVSLPGWERATGKLSGSGATYSYTGKRKQLQKLHEECLDRKNTSIGQTLSETKNHSLPPARLNNVSITSKMIDKPIQGLIERIKRPRGDVQINSADPKGLEVTPNNEDAGNLLISNTGRSELANVSCQPIIDSATQIAECVNLIDAGRSGKLLSEQTIGNGKIPNDLTTDALNFEGINEKISDCMVANVTVCLSSQLSPKSCDKEVQFPASLKSSQDTSALKATASELDTSATARRKKLRFSDDESPEYAFIPFTPKVSGPLTEHQKEVKRAQRGVSGSSHGVGIRTYTNVDFSQSEVVLDSEEPEELTLEMLHDLASREKTTDVKTGGLVSLGMQKVNSNEKGNAHGTVGSGKDPHSVNSTGCLRGGKLWRKTSESGEWKKPTKCTLTRNACTDSEDQSSKVLSKAEDVGLSCSRGSSLNCATKVEKTGGQAEAVLPCLVQIDNSGNTAGLSSPVLQSSEAAKQGGHCSISQLRSSSPKRPLLAELEERMPRRKSESQPAAQPGMVSLCSVTPFKTLRSGKRIKAMRPEFNDMNGGTQAEEGTAFNSKASMIFHEDSSKKLQGLTQPILDRCENRDNGFILEGDTQPVGKSDEDTNFAGETQPCVDRHDEIKEHLVTLMDTKWDVCDVLASLSTSSQWKSMQLQDLDAAQSLLSVLQDMVQQIKIRKVCTR